MPARRTLILVVAATLAIVPGFSGLDPLRRAPGEVTVRARAVALDADDPARSRVGRLVFLGGVALESGAAGFGGFSALAVDGERVVMLSDAGRVLAMRLGRDLRIADARLSDLPAGPGTGWLKEDRDAEAMAIDPSGRAWVAFERANAIWRYAPGLARGERWRAPAAMRRWNKGRGPEAMVRLRDGRFVVISEGPPRGRKTREGLIFADDPTSGRAPERFTFIPPAGHDVSDAAEMPDGRLLVLNRSWRFPLRFGATVTIVERGAIRPGATVRGRAIARITAPLVHDNFEGIAVTRDGADTIVWIVSDDNEWWLQRTLLLKFRLDPGA